MPVERVRAHPTWQRLAPAAVAELLMPAHLRLHITAAVVVAVDVQAAAVVVDIKAADISKQQLLSSSAKPTRSGGV